jgi:xylan 1,4-beta-xylosidase
MTGIPSATTRTLVRQYCINDRYSNSFAAWQGMGSPQNVTPAQYAALERDAALAACGAPEWRTVKSGTVAARIDLPRQGVSLIDVAW